MKCGYSVLMSLYKKENPHHLRLALDSVINQTVKPAEIVLVEDGPLTADLYKVVNEYDINNPGLLHIVKNSTNLGLGISLAKGLDECHYELVARMDTDDIAVSDRCEKQLGYFCLYPELSIVGGQIEEFIDSIDNVVGRRVVPTKDADIKEYMKKRCPFNHMTVMFKKSEVLRVGNYKDWFWNEDYYLWIRMALGDCQFANLSETLVYTRVGADMYQRRGGVKYFQSEVRIQNLLLKNKLIGWLRYSINVFERLILQVLLPNWLRGIVFRKFARKNNNH